VLSVALRSTAKAAIVVSAAIVLLLIVPEETFEIVRRRYAIAIAVVALGALALWLHRSRGSLAAATALMNVVAIGLLVPPVVTLANFQLSAMGEAERHGPPVRVPRVRVTPATKPDIYYFVFDRYGDADTMRRYAIDNGSFYSFLADRGFYVAHKSRSNYIKTALSLSSSLNMTYHDDLVRQLGADSGNWLPINYRLREHVVGRFLKSQGYRYVHAGSWWWPTRGNPLADEEINSYAAVPQAVVRLFQQPLAASVTAQIGSPVVDDRLQQWHRVRRQIAALAEVPRERGPKFVFAHFLVPHPPYVFDRDGAYVSLDEENRRTTRDNYRNQVLFANRIMRTLVDMIVSRSIAPPVIILQGDEGPYPPGIGGADRMDAFRWRNLTTEQLLERSGILNAYLLPGGPAGLSPTISPVNSFRVVFNRYFGTGLPLLPDRIYRHDSENRPYAWKDVTDDIRQRTSARHNFR